MFKLYTVVLIDKKEYDVFKTWEDAENYIKANNKSKIRIATFKETKEDMDRMVDFVNYCFTGTTYKGSLLANSNEAIHVALATKYIGKDAFSSWTIIYKGREIITFINRQYPCKDMTIEQESIIDILKEIATLFPLGSEILIGVQQDYIVSMFLEFYNPKSKKSKLFYSELNKYVSGYVVEIVKANNYLETERLLKKLKIYSKKG